MINILKGKFHSNWKISLVAFPHWDLTILIWMIFGYSVFCFLFLLSSDIHCLCLESPSLSWALENAPGRNLGFMWCLSCLPVSFLRTTVLHWLLSNADKQLLCMFCLDFILVYSEKLSPITAALWWVKPENAHTICFYFLYYLSLSEHLCSIISTIRTSWVCFSPQLLRTLTSGNCYRLYYLDVGIIKQTTPQKSPYCLRMTFLFC